MHKSCFGIVLDKLRLEVFMWFMLAAKANGGCMYQLLIPGLGLSSMQRAEEGLAMLIGLRVERLVLDCEEVSQIRFLDKAMSIV